MTSGLDANDKCSLVIYEEKDESKVPSISLQDNGVEEMYKGIEQMVDQGPC